MLCKKRDILTPLIQPGYLQGYDIQAVKKVFSKLLFTNHLAQITVGGGYDAHIHLQGDYPEKIILDHYHRWFVKNATLTMTCALAAGGKEQVLEWISQRKLDVDSLPVELWPVSKCAQAFAYKAEKGEDVFKIMFDWSK